MSQQYQCTVTFSNAHTQTDHVISIMQSSFWNRYFISALLMCLFLHVLLPLHHLPLHAGVLALLQLCEILATVDQNFPVIREQLIGPHSSPVHCTTSNWVQLLSNIQNRWSGVTKKVIKSWTEGRTDCRRQKIEAETDIFQLNLFSIIIVCAVFGVCLQYCWFVSIHVI